VYKGRKKIRIELILVVVILKEIDKVINTLTWIANHPSGWEWSKFIEEKQKLNTPVTIWCTRVEKRYVLN
jgi:hypothetical protein